MVEESAPDVMPISEAKELLGIGATTMSRLTKGESSILPWHPSPLDGRVHLVARKAVEALLAGQEACLTYTQARTYLGVNEARLRTLIKQGKLTPQRDPRFASKKVIPLAQVEHLRAAGGKRTTPATKQK